MLNFQYKAHDPSTGNEVNAKVQAENVTVAAKLIQQQGLYPIDIKEDNGGLFGFVNNRRKKVGAKDRVLFARQLSTLINAGLPLVQALRSVNDQTNNKTLRNVISDIVLTVESGQPLSVALSKNPKIFNQLFVNLIAAGETSGNLDKALERIALQQEKDAEIISKVRGAMIYPVIVLLVMVAVVVFMLVKVLPQIQMIYTSFPGAQLPIETVILLDLSKILIKYWWELIILVCVLIFGFVSLRKVPAGVRFFDLYKIKMPPLKTLFNKVYMARFARTCSTLVASGVSLLQVLQITSDVVGNTLVQESIHKAADKVKGGKSLGVALTDDPYFLPLVPNMIKIGEQSGAMEDMLGKTADYYEKEVDDAVKNISSIVEPVMMILLGIVALIIVAAVLLPVYNLAGSGALSSGGV